MKRTGRIVAMVVAAAGFAFATAAHAHPGSSAGMERHARGQGHEQHAGMQERMTQRMARHQGEHGRGRDGAAAQSGCPMTGTQSEHRH